MDKPSSKVNGLNVTQLINSFVSFDKRGLYRTIFNYYSLILFGLLIWIYLTSNFNSLPEVYNASAQDAPIYLSHRYFRLAFWIGIILFLIVELSAFLQKKLNKTNSISLLVLLGGYISAGLFMWISQPLYRFLLQYFNNQDPFKAFSKPAQVLGNLNYELYGLFLILAIALIGFSFLLRILNKLKLRLVIVRHN